MSEDTIVLVARLQVKSDAVEEAKEVALSLIEPSREEEGCINYDLHQSIEDETVFVWHETWRSKADLDEHFQKPYFAAFFAKVGEIAAAPPVITITRMISTRA